MLKYSESTSIMSKEEFKGIIEKLKIKLGNLQREAIKNSIAINIVFEGWDAAGKGTLINKLLLALDPRGYNVYPINKANEEESLRPFLWRFWKKLPEKGRISIFDRSWYGRLLHEKNEDFKISLKEINSFEKLLIKDDNLIVKFFLNVSKEEQKKRFKKLKKNKSTAWKVTKKDEKCHKEYQKYFDLYSKILDKSSKKYAKWNIIESYDWRYATVEIFKIVIKEIEKKLNNKTKKVLEKIEYKKASSDKLKVYDLSKTLSKDEYKKSLRKYQKRLRELEHEIYIKRIPVVILYEGSDAGGKGGNIRRLIEKMDPRGYEVIPIAAPSDSEKKHHYLWRFWNKIPKAGHIAIFDRTWYGRVLVERVEGFCSENDWKRAYTEINDMEKSLKDSGAVIVKFWLQIDKEEQLKRFKLRQETEYKKWKITDEDWRNREKWDDYQLAISDMIENTSTKDASWTVIEANSKYYARIKALKTLTKSLELALEKNRGE